ncbi:MULTISPECIES: ester cyclase [Luteibacter]|uniref:ester cyclase n=1 Tax=Luteibacter TaxID=242605 RepID=UPI00056B9C4C|nr:MULTISPECIES: ester cyclase [unclassified Luteibacter]SKB41561.1 Predicted ester cyclase [Luteibacter sp. 22Crub2.1]
MSESDTLRDLYRAYIDCLNRRAWPELGRHVHDDVRYNGECVGLPGYRAMLERDVRDIPDLRFDIAFVMAEPPHIACRLRFDVTPAGRFMGVAVDGRRIAFNENVFYRFEAGRIVDVWSVIDKAAIEAQLA